MWGLTWSNSTVVGHKSYKCGHCGNALAEEKGYTASIRQGGHDKRQAKIYICHFCTEPTYFSPDGRQIPGARIGHPINHIENVSVDNLFKEAQDCFSISAYTSAVICCRKLLMSISVELEAKSGNSFAYYVNFLNNNGHIPPNGKEWVDSIRKLGNEANHEIQFKTEKEAKLILTFTEMLLRFIYEMPGLMKENMEADEEVIEGPD